MRHPLGCSAKWLDWLTAVIVIAFLAVVLFGCASPEVNQLLMWQRQVQDCILSGGHPHAGPGDTIICE